MILPDTIALVLCGGNSTRMGTDKSMLQYYDKPQRYHVYDMLQPFCEAAFISCNESQSADIEESYNSLADLPHYSNVGPMGALLTAYDRFPGKNILVIGCDYPFLSVAELINFAACCTDAPAGFYNEEENLYEPLLAWYPGTSGKSVKEMFSLGQLSLQDFLEESSAVKYYTANKHCISSVDTPEDFKETRKLLSRVC